MEDEPNPQAMTGSLMRGLALLEKLSQKPAGVAELARAMDMSKGGVHRLLQILRNDGWVRQTSEGTYECTLRLWEVGVRLVERGGVQAVAMPHLQKLWEKTHETTYLAILDGSDALYLHKIDSPKRILASFRIGDRLPAYRVAAGRALLAQDGIDGLLPEEADVLEPGLKERLIQDFATIRERGYAVNNGELDQTINGIAAPVFDSKGSVVASIGFSCPHERFAADRMVESAGVVVQIARDLSRDLGYIPGR